MTSSSAIRTIEITSMDEFESNPTLMSALFSHAAAVPPFGPFAHLSCAEFCTKMKEPHEIVENKPLTASEISSFNSNQQQQQQQNTSMIKSENDDNDDNHVVFDERIQQQQQQQNSPSNNKNTALFIDDATGIAYKQVRVLVSYEIKSTLVQALCMKLWDIDQWRHWGILEAALDLRVSDVDKL